MAKKTDPQRRRKPVRRWLIRGTVVLVSLLVSEAILQVLCFFSPEIAQALSPPSPWALQTWVLPDEKYRFRGDPRVPEHDALGFRNPEVPDESAIVAIGDSQTYGTSVEWRQAWPKQLERISGLGTYNMGCSSWGPIQYRAVLDDALKLKPRLVIVGFYLGNDVYDAYRDAYFLATGADLRDPSKLDAMRKLERDDSSLERIGRLYKETQDESDAAHDVAASQHGTEPAAQTYAGYSKLYALVDVTWHIVSGLNRKAENARWRQTQQWAKKRPDHLTVVDAHDVRTILTPRYRGVAIDQSDPRIVEGLRIAKATLAQMTEICQKHNAEILVLIIPTKESVFADVVGKDQRTGDYAKLLDDERSVGAEIRNFLTEKKIDFVDLLPPLKECLSRGANPYLPSTDGHPSPAGQRALATAIVEHRLVQEMRR